VRRDEGLNSGGDSHKSLSLAALLWQAFAPLALGSLRHMVVGQLPTGLAPA
jgi:hypothetical protein